MKQRLNRVSKSFACLFVVGVVVSSLSTPSTAGPILGYMDPEIELGQNSDLPAPEEPKCEQLELFPLVTPGGGGPGVNGIPTLDYIRDAVWPPEEPPFDRVGTPSIDERFDFDS